MYKIMHKVDSSILLIIYNSLILPYLMYCIEIWGNTYSSRLRELILLQKRAIRIIDKAGFRDHTSGIFKRLKLLKFVDLSYYQTCVLMYNANKGTLPTKVQVNFKRNCDVHKYNTRLKDNFYTRQTTTQISKMSVNLKGVEIWNNLPKTTKSSVSINVFKRRIRKAMLERY